jgi:hypothetical protein
LARLEAADDRATERLANLSAIADAEVAAKGLRL